MIYIFIWLHKKWRPPLLCDHQFYQLCMDLKLNLRALCNVEAVLTVGDVQLIRRSARWRGPPPVSGCVDKAASGDPDRNIAWCHCASSQSQPSSGSRDHQQPIRGQLSAVSPPAGAGRLDCKETDGELWKQISSHTETSTLTTSIWLSDLSIFTKHNWLPTSTFSKT